VASAEIPTVRSWTVVIRGRLSDRLAGAFPGMSFDRPPGRTVIRGRADRARLEALLDELRDLGLEPLSVDVED
jgi:hypothetical protein